METKGKYVIFDTDNEFTDFSVAQNAAGIIVEDSKTGTMSVQFQQPWERNYSELYLELYLRCLEEEKTFVIKEKDSAVCRRGCVSKRVPVMYNGAPLQGQTTLIQLNVENVEEYDPMLHGKR